MWYQGSHSGGAVMRHVGVRAFRDKAIVLARERIAPVPEAMYDAHEAVTRSRIPRDSDDWHTVARAPTSDAAIGTADAEFLGCGIAPRTTDTLLVHLAYVEAK
jgi:PIN domain